LITQVIASPEIQKIVTSTSSENLTAFLLLLDRKMETLRKVVEIPLTSFTWEQPHASYPASRAIEDFLHSSREKLSYANFSGVAEARNFGQLVRDGQKTGQYRVVVKEVGTGRAAKCEISKTKEGYQLAVEIASKLKKELSDLTLLRRSIVQHTVTESPVPGTSNYRKNRMKNTDESPTTKRAKTVNEPHLIIDLT
jgi:hypothetical protein